MVTRPSSKPGASKHFKPKEFQINEIQRRKKLHAVRGSTALRTLRVVTLSNLLHSIFVTPKFDDFSGGDIRENNFLSHIKSY